MQPTVPHHPSGPVARSLPHPPSPAPTDAGDRRSPASGGAMSPAAGAVPSPRLERSGRPDPGPEPQGDVHLETRRGRLVVRFEGEIDTAVRARFERVLLVVRAAHEPVEVDCRDVTFFCAEGVRMLMLLQSAAGGPGVTALRSSPWVDRALRLAGVDHYPSVP